MRARPNVSVGAFVVVAVLVGSLALLAGYAEASPEWHLRDDATGGDCTQFGSWDGTTKTCRLTSDVEGRVFLDADGLVLDGNGHRIAQGSQGPCLAFEGNLRWCTVYANGRSGLTVKNAVIVQADGVWLENSPNATVRNNTFEADGHVVHLYRSSGSIVEGNAVRAQANGCGCIYVQESSDMVVENNEIPGPGYGGLPPIDMFYGSRNVISENRVSSPMGIRVRNAHGPTVSGNTVTGAIGIYSSGYATLTANSATSTSTVGSVGGKYYGLYLDGSADATITGNSITRDGNLNPWFGVYLLASSRATITGNTLTSIGSLGGAGFLLTGGSESSTVSGNTATNLRMGFSEDPGWFWTGPGSNISANIFDSFSDVAINTYSGGTTIAGNAISNGPTGILVGARNGPQTITENSIQVSWTAIRGDADDGDPNNDPPVSIHRNTLEGGAFGIDVYRASSFTVSENTITGSGVGIRLSEAGSNTVRDNVVAFGQGEGNAGIELGYFTSRNIVRGNRFQQNSIGARFNNYAVSNSLFHNCFDRNTLQIQPYGVPGHTWDDGAGLGNYWSDYAGLDDGSGGRPAGDGVGDTNLPHQGVDFYPVLASQVCGTNERPVVSITSPPAGSVYPVGAQVTFTGAFTDEGDDGVHTATWWFDGITIPGTVTESGGSGTVTDVYAFLSPGVYPINLNVTDSSGANGSADTVDGLAAFVVIYDPNGGFVTGGGWFDSAPGSFAEDAGVSGRATFGFVSRYQKGKSFPTGETEFQFKVADLNFHSASYDWLVCGGPKCQFKGHGTINGLGGYSFLLTAIDGDLPGGGGQDKIRMKIWVTLTGQIVYDNQMGMDDNADPTTVIGGGSILIHKG